MKLEHVEVRWSEDSKRVLITAWTTGRFATFRSEIPDPQGLLAGAPDSEVRDAVRKKLRADDLDAPADWLFGWTIEQAQYKTANSST